MEKKSHFVNIREYIKLLSCFTAGGALCRLWFLLYHHSAFKSLSIADLFHSMFWGLRFDFAVASIFSLISLISLLIFNKVKLLSKLNFPLLLLLLFMIGIFGSDLMYFEESGRHISYEIKDGGVDAISLFFLAFTTYLKVTLSGCILIILFILISTRLNATKWKFNASIVSTLVFAILIGAIGIRGGLQMVPMNPEMIYQIGDTKKAQIVNNAVYTSLYAVLNDKQLAQMASFQLSNVEINRAFNEIYNSLNTSRLNKIDKNFNKIVFVFLEGWTAYNMNSYGADYNATPNYDKLMKASLTSFATVAGGHRTTEGIFSSYCSYPNPLGKTVAKTHLQNFSYECLPQILRDEGWQTEFIQGSLKETSGTGSFVQALGVQKSFGREDIAYKELGYNYWGAHDGDIYKFAFDRLNTNKKIFLGINTNSNHDFKMPKGVEPKFGQDNNLFKNLSITYYADQELGKFVDKLFLDHPDSLLIMVGDHTGFTTGLIHHQYMVPFLIYYPGISARRINAVTTQRDIAPTILDILNLPNKSKHFTGRSLIGNEIFYSDVFHNGEFAWFENKKMFIFNSKDNSTKSYEFGENIRELVKIENDPTAIQRAKAFIQKTQDLLFIGETKKFSVESRLE